MRLVTPCLDLVFQTLLRSRPVRRHFIEQAFKNELSRGRLGKVVLRNLNQLMDRQPQLHDEIRAIFNRADYLHDFWNSDLGYLWFQGNYRIRNSYFERVERVATEKGYRKILDIGCGWGELAYRLAKADTTRQVVGIDISAPVIEKAKSLHQQQNLKFNHVGFENFSENFDLITSIGAPDYIPVDQIERILTKMISQTTHELLLVHSLRGISFEQFQKITESRCVRRFDEGYVHPIPMLLGKLRQILPAITYDFEKIGLDSVLISVRHVGAEPR